MLAVRGASARLAAALVCALAAVPLAGCGGGGHKPAPGDPGAAAKTVTVTATAPVSGSSRQAAGQLGFPSVATRNTTRIATADPIAQAAAVALAVYPSAAPGTHPQAVTIAPTSDWEAALAASVLMAPPIHAPVLLSGPRSLPPATADALTTLAPTGSGGLSGAQVVLVGQVPRPSGLHAATISGQGPYATAAAIDRFATAAAGGRASRDVVVTSSSAPGYAMPAAGWAAESGDPILFVSPHNIPLPTIHALQSHQHPNIYVLDPPSVLSNKLLKQLGRYGTVKRISGADPAASSAAFAAYRDPACPYGHACAHIPGSFGWALRGPGHGYTLLRSSHPLSAAASAALSGTGDYGPQLLVDNGSTLPKPVLNFFLNYATPGFYSQQGPTAAVYDHAWIIGDTNTISVAVQAEVDELLQAIPASSGR